MSKNYNSLLLVGIFGYLVISSNCWISKTIKRFDYDAKLNKMVTTIIENCNLGLQSIIVYSDNNSQSTFEALSKLKIPVTKLLMSGKHMIDTVENFYDVENQGLVLAMNTKIENFSLYGDIMFEWQCIKNCTVIIVPKPHDNCDDMSLNLLDIAKRSIYNTYYLCIRGIPMVYTFELYGDSTSSHWERMIQVSYRYSTLTLYNRTFREAEICKGFSFERPNSTHNDPILIAIHNDYLPPLFRNVKNTLFNSGLKKKIEGTGEVLDVLEKLTRTKFMYYTGGEIKDYAAHVLKDQLVDIVFPLIIIGDYKLSRHIFVPTHWGSYAILSHNRGLRTPLEKIGHFYGVWTLSSLIVISVLTFIVIYYKMHKNIAFAAYDILRLLINSGVSVPMNTLSLQIFFCMIFLYFMIIHATFSGNLAKFLTIPEYRKNIDSFQELTDPRIKTVYCMHTICFIRENYDLLYNKFIPVSDYNVCIDQTVKNSSSACLSLSTILRQYIGTNIDDTTLYLSKDFAPFMSSYRYRKQFILREQFNKALMYMNELDLSVRPWKKKDKVLDILFEIARAQSEINFRAITVEDLKFALIFLLIGNSLALICFIIEIFVYRKNRNVQ